MIKNNHLFFLLLSSYCINKAIDSNIHNKNENESILIDTSIINDQNNKGSIDEGSILDNIPASINQPSLISNN